MIVFTRLVPVQASRTLVAATALFCAGAICTMPAARAETLMQALTSTYVNNPTINAERAQLRAVDENVAQANSGFRPDITFGADASISHQNSSNGAFAGINSNFLSGGSGKSRPGGYDFNLTQPLFQGFRNINNLREAKATVAAERKTLESVVQQVMLDAVTAYMNVVRDQAIVELRENNVKVLSEQLQATNDRFNVGEVTRTDVSQAQARRAGAVSDLSLARANLQSSRAAYEQIIGHPPSGLKYPSSIARLLPDTLPAAADVGDQENPQVLAAIFNEDAARFNMKKIAGEMLPSANLEINYRKSYEPSISTEEAEETTVGGRLTVPLYQGGEVSSRVRQAKEIIAQRRRQVEEARRLVRANITSAWGVLTSARAQTVSDRSQVDANRVALEGVKEEEKVGQRTILDVLNAQQEYLNAQVTLQITLRDEVVAVYSLLSSVGRLNVVALNLPVERYDPMIHYDHVKNKLFGLSPTKPTVLQELRAKRTTTEHYK